MDCPVHEEDSAAALLSEAVVRLVWQDSLLPSHVKRLMLTRKRTQIEKARSLAHPGSRRRRALRPLVHPENPSY
eukprot:460846-Prorocentrum_lima.AAC.1